MEAVRDAIVDIAASTLEYAILNPGYVLIGALAALGVVIGCWLVGSSWRNRNKGYAKMGKKQRKHYVFRETADALLDALDARYEKGTLTRDEVNRMYRLIAHSAGLWDLYPRRVVVYPNQEILKAELQERKAAREAKGINTPPATVKAARFPTMEELLGIKKTA